MAKANSVVVVSTPPCVIMAALDCLRWVMAALPMARGYFQKTGCRSRLIPLAPTPAMAISGGCRRRGPTRPRAFSGRLYLSTRSKRWLSPCTARAPMPARTRSGHWKAPCSGRLHRRFHLSSSLSPAVAQRRTCTLVQCSFV